MLPINRLLKNLVRRKQIFNGRQSNFLSNSQTERETGRSEKQTNFGFQQVPESEKEKKGNLKKH